MLSDMVPFRLAGNLYFVGCHKASSHLFDTGEGLILLDTGNPGFGEAVMESIRALGFKVEDIKYIIHSHGHYDHTGATAEILKHCEAETFLNKNDEIYLDGSFKPDHDIREGDVIRLGNTEIHCMFTPGHTPGTVSFFFDLVENGQKYRAGMFGGTGINQMTRSYLLKNDLPYFGRADYLASIERLKREKVEIFVGNHVGNNDTEGNYKKSLTSKTNPFIDSERWGRFLESRRADLFEMIEKDAKREFVTYAHRGASEYAPENTMMAFNLGIFMGANGIETDVRLTKDGVPVLFHDGDMMRTTEREGSIADLTYEELKSIYVKAHGKYDRIVRLDDFLEAFGFRDITLAIELKAKGTAKAVTDAVAKYGVGKKTVITSFDYEEVCIAKSLAQGVKCGYLTSNVTDELLTDMRKHGIDEICPKATDITAELVIKWHSLGFNVRAWGVKDEEIMRSVYDMGVNGMTVNFPDKLVAYIESKNDE